METIAFGALIVMVVGITGTIAAYIMEKRGNRRIK